MALTERHSILALQAIGLIVFSCVLITSHFPTFQDSYDKRAYWAAAKVFMDGRDPYQLPNIVDAITGEIPGSLSPEFVWGPPHIFALLAPISLLSLNFPRFY